MVVSFVIPAYNEARFIAGTIDAIHETMDRRHRYEIIVVDHGSNDGTREIATRHGARVHRCHEGTVGTLRNTGVRHATGEVLVFIDADVRLCADWGDQFDSVLDLLAREPRTLTGSTYGISVDPGWIERFWFRPELVEMTHINSGHLITTRAFFDELGGFDESLETGEDYDLSARARAVGGGVVLNPALRVHHEGFPRTLRAFIRREMWHAAGDFQSARSVLRSLVAIATIFFVLAHLTVLAGLFGNTLGIAVGGMTLAMCVCTASAIRKLAAGKFLAVPTTSMMFYFYYWGRALGMLRALWPNRALKWSRTPGVVGTHGTTQL